MWRPDLQGWLTDHEAATLQELAAGRHVLEIGVWKGRSTIALASQAWSVLAVDWFRGDEFTGPANTLPEAWENIRRENLVDTVTLIVGDWRDIVGRIDLGDIGLAYYDAGHSYDDTQAALALLLVRLPPDAVIAVHDYEPGSDAYDGVVRAVTETARRSGRKLAVVDRLAVLLPEGTADANPVPLPDLQSRAAAV